MIGLRLNYRSSLETFAGLRLAHLIQDLGEDVSILSTGPQSSNVHSGFDHKVLSENTTKISTWTQSCYQIIYVQSVPVDELMYAIQQKKPTVLFGLYDMPPIEHEQIIRYCRNVVISNRSLAKFMKETWNFDNLTYIPTEPNVPIYNQDIECTPNIIISIPHSSSDNTVHDTIQLIQSILDKTTANITVLQTKSIQSKLRNTISRLDKDRIKLVGLGSWEDLIITFSKASMFISMTSVGMINSGVLQQIALSCGVPIIAPDTLGYNEYLQNGHNSVLLPYTKKKGKLTPPTVTKYQQSVLRLLTQKNTWKKLRKNCYNQILSRRKLMVNRWREVLDL